MNVLVALLSGQIMALEKVSDMKQAVLVALGIPGLYGRGHYNLRLQFDQYPECFIAFNQLNLIMIVASSAVIMSRGRIHVTGVLL